EDHPFDYASFEGVIPRGQYGAGEVIVWDCGVFVPEREHDREPILDRAEADRYALEALARGKLSFLLRGVKLKGSFALVRMSDGKQWLLIKHKDAYASDAGIEERAASVLSALRVEDLANGEPPPRILSERLIPHGPFRRMPTSIQPMLAERGPLPRDVRNWMYEPKLDGYRIIALIRGKNVRLQSRRGLDLSVAFPEIVAELAAQRVGQMILDTELVALDERGAASFNALQSRAGLKTAAEVAAAQRTTPVMQYAFDMLHFEGMDLCGAEYVDRRRYLMQCVLPMPRVQLVPASDDAQALIAGAAEAGLEGVMAKRKRSPYRPGARSGDWIKVKPGDAADLVVGGYTEGLGARKSLGSLVLGYWDGKALRHAGNVGSGFDTGSLERVRRALEKLKSDRSPFAERAATGRPTTWVRPQMVVEVAHAGWTPGGKLRAPIFQRVREDLDPASIRRREANPSFAAAPQARGKTADKVAKPATAADVESDVLEQLARAKGTAELAIGDARVRVTHLDREYWPAERSLKQPAITKRDLLRYLVRISPYMLPHLRYRPLTMIRMPAGIDGERFFQKHWDKETPEFVASIELYSETKGKSHHYLLCQNLPTLVWLGQMGTLEFHVWHSRAEPGADAATRSEDYASSSKSIDESILNYPDYIVFDIDPYIYSGKEAPGGEPELNDRAFMKGVQVAVWLHDLLERMKLPSIVKTSGKTGLHVFVPIERTISFDVAREFAERIGRHLLREHPRDITMEWQVKQRTGKIFIDYNMNVRGKTLNVAYSPRGVRGAPVSMPVTWRQLPRVHPLDFRITNAVERVQKRGDVWHDIPKVNLARALEP
ncbi:MAG TPA: non-homologous end-joining DNA ligase, partial [Steroidobacteraceae bacterium]|nr:non-homologous end-joining DNA ligase [Steroidobacteraceae bacterium]